jgi:thiamine-phosphate diphosphorylase
MKAQRELSGLYLVASPILPNEQLVDATEQALEGGVDILQLSATEKTAGLRTLSGELARLADQHHVPFLVNNNLELAKVVEADGVHLDAFDVSPAEIREVLGNEALVGYTVNVDLGRVQWAAQVGADYISFCSIFHQCPGGQCPIVPLDAVKQTAAEATVPVFAAGGINLDNLYSILDTGVDGVVVTSAILKANDPKQATKNFKQIMAAYKRK